MAQYRKKPVVIEAYEFQNRIGADTRPQWLTNAVLAGYVHFHNSASVPPHLTIDTLEGVMRADIGDFIIQGVKGEIYPCKPDIFAATYEAADAPEDDGVDPTTSELLKPRGNKGIVSSDICFNALLLVGGTRATEAQVASWTIEQRDRAYDWAMRMHLHASDNDDVFVPERPDFIPREARSIAG